MKTHISLAMLMFVASTVYAEPRVLFQKNVTDNLKIQIEKKEYTGILETIRLECDDTLKAASSHNVTVFERAENAEVALQCVKKGRSVLLAMAANAEERARVKELLQSLNEEAAQIKQQADSESSFMGLNWGMGFGYSFGSDEMIDDAEVIGGIVRVKSRKKEQPRVIFEFHKYFWCNNNYTNGTRGCGPFVAVAASQDKLLSGVSMGFMYGFKTKATDTDGFSIGLGAILDGKVKDLADGFKENAAPPAGETQVRYEEKSRWSYLLFVTRTF